MIVTFNPVAFAIGQLAVRWFGLLALVGLGLTIWLSMRGLERSDREHTGRERRVALDALAWGLPAGLLCARLVHVIGWWEYYFTHAAEIWRFNIDGLSLWGGLLGGCLIGFARLKRDPLRRRRIFDVVAPYAALGIAIGRIAAFLDGHGQGLPSDLSWATVYASPLAATPDFGVPRHPAQLYDAVLALLVFVVLLSLPKRLPAGTRLATFFVLYGLGRVALGAVRLDPAFLFGLQIEQLLALGGVAFGILFAVRPMLSRRQVPLTSPSASTGQTRRTTTEDPMAA